MASALLAALPVAAVAQTPGIAATVTLQSNQTFRGESISRDSPGASAALSIDGPLGLFVGADASIALNEGALRLTADSQYAGVAVRLGRFSLELGGVHRHYRDIVDTDYDRDYSELFLGVARGRTRLRGYLSRDYNREGKLTGYAELETRLWQSGRWSLDVHGGLSFVPQDPGATTSFPRVYEDWGLTLGAEWRGFNAALGLTSANYPVISESGRVRVSLSVSKSF